MFICLGIIFTNYNYKHFKSIQYYVGDISRCSLMHVKEYMVKNFYFFYGFQFLFPKMRRTECSVGCFYFVFPQTLLSLMVRPYRMLSQSESGVLSPVLRMSLSNLGRRVLLESGMMESVCAFSHRENPKYRANAKLIKAKLFFLHQYHSSSYKGTFGTKKHIII